MRSAVSRIESLRILMLLSFSSLLYRERMSCSLIRRYVRYSSLFIDNSLSVRYCFSSYDMPAAFHLFHRFKNLDSMFVRLNRLAEVWFALILWFQSLSCHRCVYYRYRCSPLFLAIFRPPSLAIHRKVLLLLLSLRATSSP